MEKLNKRLTNNQTKLVLSLQAKNEWTTWGLATTTTNNNNNNNDITLRT